MKVRNLVKLVNLCKLCDSIGVSLEEVDEVVAASLCLMTNDEAADAVLTSSRVARLLRLSQATVGRLPKEQLDYWETPGGHRRYRRADVARYAREHQGREIEVSPDVSD